MKRAKTVLKYIAITLLILVVAQAAKQIGRAAAQPVDNPPQHVQEERTIKQARVDVYHHESVDGWQPCINGEYDNGECK